MTWQAEMALEYDAIIDELILLQNRMSRLMSRAAKLSIWSARCKVL